MFILPFILNQIMPFVMIVVGYLLHKKPVEKISSNGYNTRVSRKSQENWDYGQKIAPGIFMSMGITLCVIELVISVVFTLLRKPEYINVFAGEVVGFVVVFMAFCKTDSEIKKNEKGTL